MRTTVDLDEDVLRELKRRAVDTGRTMSEVLDELLRRAMVPPRQPREPIKLVTFGGEPAPGPQPGVDLDNSSDLRELMDSDEVAFWREQAGGDR